MGVEGFIGLRWPPMRARRVLPSRTVEEIKRETRSVAAGPGERQPSSAPRDVRRALLLSAAAAAFLPT